jgi:hypothetical protein
MRSACLERAIAVAQHHSDEPAAARHRPEKALRRPACIAPESLKIRQNRKRDDRLRDQNRTSLATALYAELKQFRDGWIADAEGLKQAGSGLASMLVRAPEARLFPQLVTEIGLLPPDAIRAVSEAYAVIDQYKHDLLLLENAYKKADGVEVPGRHAGFLVKYNTVKA